MSAAGSVLVLGGVRSGKSRLAERLALQSASPVVYIATATRSEDAEMDARIAAHRSRRPAEWRTLEVPMFLSDTLREHAAPDRCLLVDCLTLWLTNLLCAPDASLLRRECDALIAAMPSLPGRVILVGNETGLGVVPLGELSRRFVDQAGVLHQRLAEVCDTVVFTVAGLPHYLKGNADEC